MQGYVFGDKVPGFKPSILAFLTVWVIRFDKPKLPTTSAIK